MNKEERLKKANKLLMKFQRKLVENLGLELRGIYIENAEKGEYKWGQLAFHEVVEEAQFEKVEESSKEVNQ